MAIELNSHSTHHKEVEVKIMICPSITFLLPLFAIRNQEKSARYIKYTLCDNKKKHALRKYPNHLFAQLF